LWNLYYFFLVPTHWRGNAVKTH